MKKRATTLKTELTMSPIYFFSFCSFLFLDARQFNVVGQWICCIEIYGREISRFYWKKMVKTKSTRHMRLGTTATDLKIQDT